MDVIFRIWAFETVFQRDLGVVKTVIILLTPQLFNQKYHSMCIIFDWSTSIHICDMLRRMGAQSQKFRFWVFHISKWTKIFWIRNKKAPISIISPELLSSPISSHCVSYVDSRLISCKNLKYSKEKSITHRYVKQYSSIKIDQFINCKEFCSCKNLVEYWLDDFFRTYIKLSRTFVNGILFKPGNISTVQKFFDRNVNLHLIRKPQLRKMINFNFNRNAYANEKIFSYYSK